MTRDEFLETELLSAVHLLHRYGDTRDAVLLGEEHDASNLAQRLDTYAGSWRTEIHTTKDIFRADEDKPHRCPVCHTIPDNLWEGPKWKRWRIYTCRHGHRFSGLPFITKEYVTGLELENGDGQERS